MFVEGLCGMPYVLLWDVFVAPLLQDYSNNVIRRISANGATITTILGNRSAVYYGDGIAASSARYA
jgi:hypothetical protein